MQKKSFIVKGDICFSRDKDVLETLANHYLVCEDGISRGVFQEVPERFGHLEVLDYQGKLVIPGLTDLHVHAPQYAFRGTGMDMELLDWLNSHAFPEECKYRNLEYAEEAYGMFAEDLRRSATTRACIFATLHAPATTLLMEKLAEAGLAAYVGKVNMDRNCPDYLVEESASKAGENTIRWVEETAYAFEHVKPILTPRFIPTCTDELMTRLKGIQEKYQLPLQSHLSENQGEVAWVKELCPDAKFYGDAYDQFGLFGGSVETIMAHCVSSSDEEIRRMKERGVYIAHCPQSNTNLASGIAPVRRYLDEGLKLGLGSDIAGGSSLSIFRAMTDAIQMSKIRWRLSDETLKPLTMEEAFYMGSKGGGSFFGKAGSFEEGYEADILVLDESRIRHPQELNLKERLERFLYLSDDCGILHKFMSGNQLF